MNISTDILEFLKLFGKASVPSFGVFSIQKTSALLDNSSNTLLPPSQQIIFNKQHIENDEGLIQFLAKRKRVSPAIAEFTLQEQVKTWSELWNAQQNFSIAGIGEFSFANNEFSFVGNRIEDENADFFGLEEIKISDIQKPSSYKTPKNSRKQEGSAFNKVLLWTFLVIIPILGIIYLAFTQQDLLFGKKSFGEITIQNSTHRIKEIPKIDSLKTNSIQDSIQKNITPTNNLPQQSIPNGK